MYLSELPKGVRASLTGFATAGADAHSDSLERRLRAVGFDEGCSVELLYAAPLGGDPIIVRVETLEIALRRREAAAIIVDPIAMAGQEAA